MIIIIIIIMMMMMIIIRRRIRMALKGAIRDFYDLLSLQKARSSGQCAIVCKSRATCCVPRGMKGQFSYYV